MPKVYQVNDLHGEVRYVNTSREVNALEDGYESVERVDAADECNKLIDEVHDAKRCIIALRNLLADLVERCPDDVLETTEAGKRAARFIAENPLPPATAGDRDGGRSYGAG